MICLCVETEKGILNYPLKEGETTIGLLEENDICLPYKGISKRHCKFLRRGENIKIIDLESKNGIFVNGERIKEKEVSINDLISIGSLNLHLKEIDEDDLIPSKKLEEKSKFFQTPYFNVFIKNLYELLEIFSKGDINLYLPNVSKILNSDLIIIANEEKKFEILFLYDPESILSKTTEEDLENLKENSRDWFYHKHSPYSILIKKGRNEFKEELYNFCSHLLLFSIEGYKKEEGIFHYEKIIFPEGYQISQNEKMKEIYSSIEKIAPFDIPVLILGETGVGKDEIAKIIHLNSLRRNKQYGVVLCHAIPETIIEAELFGYEKGSFTGAIERKIGILRKCNGGTVFIDEIGEVPLRIQAKILRFIETKRFMPIGLQEEIEVDVRFIFATNKDLKELVKEGKFREDLYYRISRYILKIPPLRERKDELSLLINYFLQHYSNKYNKKINGLTVKARKILENYKWPGNIRQLMNVIEELVLKVPSDGAIDSSVLPQELQKNIIEDEITYEVRKISDIDLKKFIYPIAEKIALEEALKRTGGNYLKMAKILGISRLNLKRLLKKHNLYKEKEPGRPKGIK